MILQPVFSKNIYSYTIENMWTFLIQLNNVFFLHCTKWIQHTFHHQALQITSNLSSSKNKLLTVLDNSRSEYFLSTLTQYLAFVCGFSFRLCKELFLHDRFFDMICITLMCILLYCHQVNIDRCDVYCKGHNNIDLLTAYIWWLLPGIYVIMHTVPCSWELWMQKLKSLLLRT